MNAGNALGRKVNYNTAGVVTASYDEGIKVEFFQAVFDAVIFFVIFYFFMCGAL